MTFTLKVPAIVTLIGSLILGLLQVLNETVFQPASAWHAYIAIALVFGAGLGLKALSGGLFAAALKLPQWANFVISAAIAAATLALTTDHGISVGVHAIIATALTILAALGFGQPAPAPLPPPPPPKARPRPRRPSRPSTPKAA